MDRDPTAANAATPQPCAADAAQHKQDALAGLDALRLQDAPGAEPKPEMDVATLFGDFEVVNAEEIAREDVPPAKPLLVGVFERGDVGQVSAPPKCKKSFAVCDLGLHLAAGRDWCGLRVTRKCNVVYLNAELKADALARRLRTMMFHGEIRPEDVGDRFKVVNGRGDSEGLRSALEEWPKDDSTDVVIVDPVSSIMLPGEDECNADDVRQLCQVFARVADNGPAVLCVLHDRKGDVSGLDLRDRVAGSGVYARTCDFRLTLTPAEGDKERGLCVEVLTRNTEAPAPFTIVFDPRSCTFRHVDVPPIRAKYGQTNADAMLEKSAVEIVAQSPGITAGDLKTQLHVLTGKHESKCREIVKAAEAKGLIVGTVQRHVKGYPATRYNVCAPAFTAPGGGGNA